MACTLDAPAATLFPLALLAQGSGSSVVATYAGQVVMPGFVRQRVPLPARCALTLVPVAARPPIVGSILTHRFAGLA